MGCSLEPGKSVDLSPNPGPYQLYHFVPRFLTSDMEDHDSIVLRGLLTAK